MQAIITKFLSPTNTRGARIKATCLAGSVTIPYAYEHNTQYCHWLAAKALIEELGWSKYKGKWVCGGSPDDTGFVFVNDAFDCDSYTTG